LSEGKAILRQGPSGDYSATILGALGDIEVIDDHDRGPSGMIARIDTYSAAY
jgi:hypothetical protein